MDKFEIKKAELDKELKSASPDACIIFGAALFEEFRIRGWITLEKCGALGTKLFEEMMYAYQKTHIASIDDKLQDLDFKVGKSV